MDTKILKIDSENVDGSLIKVAADILKNGGLVAFPTETVYGLGANAFDVSAVKGIFTAKGRPNDNPLIVHISDESKLDELVVDVNSDAKKLMDAFWPGPLTIIFKKKECVPLEVTGGLDSVAVRVPKGKIAFELIRESGVPVVAPSANLSGKPSPTDGVHTIEDLDGKVDCIIDGGSVDIGLESTVIDMTSDVPEILRPGRVTKEDIESVIGHVVEACGHSETPKSPGMKYKHYSPSARVVIVNSEEAVDEFVSSNSDLKIRVLKYSCDEEMGRNMFRDFRLADSEGYDVILVYEVSETGFGRAIMNRLKRASGE